MELTVHAVVIPPMKPGHAFAHAPDGRCFSFTGERGQMIALCESVKLHNLGQRGPVSIWPAEWQSVLPITPDQCPAHCRQAA